MANEVTFEIMEHIGVLKEGKDGWQREANVVAWNGGAPKIDIRDWSPDHTRMTRGITMLDDEAKRLAKALSARYASR